MRIAVVSPHLPTPALPMRGVRGSEQLRLFHQAGHEVRAVVPLAWSPRRPPVPEEERDGAVPVLHPRYPRPPRRLAGLGVGLAVERRLFARVAADALAAGWGAPDVVLAHSAALPGGLLGRIGGAPLVVALHDHELYELAPRSALVRGLLARTLRGARCAVYVSEALRRAGLRLAGPHRSLVIPIGIDAAAGLTWAPPGPFTICTVARLVARKRVDRLIRAVARLRAEGRDARLVIVGDGPERPALERLRGALGVADRVELAGALDARGAQERMARASVVALPSVLESLGAVYLEAMALGVPALGTRGEGIAAHMEDGVSGVLVPPGDDAALVAALRALADDPGRARRIGAAGRARFQAGGFSWAENAAAYLALFAELARGG
jgi:glycosyltransferase involved in cell wall biosynthesis